ncbi:MAG: FHA domain-containing protein [Oscillospiraceae bacterium]|nr:FHA domain-containing protein [Oscillospiraceae bacterium]
MFGSDLMAWILIAAVSLSLVLSVITLILQILRGRASKNKPDKKEKSGLYDKPPVPPVWEAGGYPYQAQAPQAWVPPVVPVQQGGHTEPLFSASPQSFAAPGDGGSAQNNGYRVYIREMSPNGERSYEIIVNGEFPVGRSPSRGLQIDNATVSGLHCVLIAGPDNVFVSNRSNSNITMLNGVRLEDTRPLKPGDSLSLGKVQLVLIDIRKNAAY